LSLLKFYIDPIPRNVENTFLYNDRLILVGKFKKKIRGVILSRYSINVRTRESWRAKKFGECLNDRPTVNSHKFWRKNRG